MIDWISSDKGWSLEYTNSLTYRQIMTLWVRLWARVEFDARLKIKLDPWASSSDDKGKKPKPEGTLDLTDENDLSELLSRDNAPFAIKTIPKSDG